MTRANEHKPVRRIVSGRMGDDYVAEVLRDRLTLRPKGARSERVIVRIEWGALYVRLLTARIEQEQREKRRLKRKGRVTR